MTLMCWSVPPVVVALTGIRSWTCLPLLVRVASGSLDLARCTEMDHRSWLMLVPTCWKDFTRASVAAEYFAPEPMATLENVPEVKGCRAASRGPDWVAPLPEVDVGAGAWEVVGAGAGAEGAAAPAAR